MLACAAAGAGGLCAAAFVALASGYVGDRMRVSALQRRAGAGNVAYRLLKGGVPAFKGVGIALLRLKSLRRCVSRLDSVLALKGFESSRESLASLLCACCTVLVLGCALAGSWLAGVAFAACLVVALSAWANRSFERRRETIREALPDAVRAMSACFHAGFTLQQTFDQLQRELPGPVGSLFGSARDAMKTGSTAQEALARLRKNGAVSELSFVAVALEVQHRAGGSMRHVLAAACESLEGELELRRELRVHTAQARLSAKVVTGVTVGLVGVLCLISEDFLAPFFSSATGVVLLAMALCMQVAGIVIVRRMLQVEVD